MEGIAEIFKKYPIGKVIEIEHDPENCEIITVTGYDISLKNKYIVFENGRKINEKRLSELERKRG